jgi:uracil-DNA glycosylase
MTWKELLIDEYSKDYFVNLIEFVNSEYKKFPGKILPAQENIFRALVECKLDNLKVIILGQDPYHTEGVADGLAFSSLPKNKVPPSLKNIYKELMLELGNNYLSEERLNFPDLTAWAKQGVLLLNSTLKLYSHKPASHAKKGWEEFTDQVIEKISQNFAGKVFILWGNFAKSKQKFIDTNKHLILTSAHPSPFSANNGFFGNKHFLLTNSYLQKNNQVPINWSAK